MEEDRRRRRGGLTITERKSGRKGGRKHEPMKTGRKMRQEGRLGNKEMRRSSSKETGIKGNTGGVDEEE